MSGILFEISYSIYPEKRADYLELIEKLKDAYKNDSIQMYSVYEDAKSSNSFKEVMFFEDDDKFDQFEDNQTEEAAEIVSKLINEIIKDRKVKYLTLRQV